MAGFLRAIHTAPREGDPMQSVAQVEVRAGHGIVGDKGAGNQDRELTVFRREDFHAALKHAGLEGKAADGASRRNLELEGISAEALRGPILLLGDVVLKVMDECHPCKLMETYVGAGAREALQGRAGVTCVVIRGGTLQVGCPVAATDRMP